MYIAIWLIVGIVAGLLAQYLLKDEWRGGLPGNLVLGTMGAVTSGWVMMRLFGTGDATGVHNGNLVFAFLGALGLLWVGRLVAVKRVRAQRRRAQPRRRRDD
ncbi:MAG: GlsB/YeaQ/YmgE family stress response membrane protein [Armatimonadetes bacterium]|nr:GlsB/YeaQ/YmgE family stress response membrane protein [Armatimonadota bacterium]